MSVMQTRGGVPEVFRDTITTGGRAHSFRSFLSYIIVRALTNPCRIYFTEADYIADANYVTVPIPAATTPYGEWQGPTEIGEIWLRGVTGSSDIEIVGFQRRG
jgi:hypothetical protein